MKYFMISLALLGFLSFGCSTSDDDAIRALRNHDTSTKSGNWNVYKFGVAGAENVTTLLDNLHKNQLAFTKIICTNYAFYVWVPECGKVVDCK